MKIEETRIVIILQSPGGLDILVEDFNDNYFGLKQWSKLHRSLDRDNCSIYFLEQPSKLGFRIEPISVQRANFLIKNTENYLYNYDY